LNHPIESWSINQLKRPFLSREEAAGCPFYVFYKLLGFCEMEIILLDRQDRKINQESQVTDLSILLSFLFISNGNLPVKDKSRK
jgi:hypothetical protein